MSLEPPRKAPHYRAVWISDVHLGFKNCRADYLLDFLHSVRCDTLYLVGDIIDFWAMRRSLYWPQEHNNVVRTLLGKAKHGTQVLYVPGNHDEILRDYVGMRLGNVEICDRAIHTTADGRRFLVLHGDQFDSVVKCSRLLAMLGGKGYGLLLGANRYVNWVRRRLGFPYWSLAAHIKHKVKNAVNFISHFEQAVAHEARAQHVDGLICGHIHHAEIRDMDGVLYINDGDWVESCTALVEHADGQLELLHWSDRHHAVKHELSALARAA